MHKGVRGLRRLRTELAVAEVKYLHHGHSTHRVVPKYSQRVACELGIVVNGRFPGERRHTFSSKVLILTSPLPLRVTTFKEGSLPIQRR